MHEIYLREAIALAASAKAKGNGPFGAVLVDETGTVLLQAENTVDTNRDVTGHAETNLLREAYAQFGPEKLALCTVYSSAEPCAMCSGTLYWSGVGRVVYGVSIPRLRAVFGDDSRQMRVRCHEIVTSGTRAVEVIGPLLEDEAWQVFDAERESPDTETSLR